MDCNKIENNVVFGSTLNNICESPIRISYTQVGDTNSLYTATKLYEITCDEEHYETSGYYRVQSSDKWRYWDETLVAFTQSGICSECVTTTTTTLAPPKISCWRKFINFLKNLIKKIIK